MKLSLEPFIHEGAEIRTHKVGNLKLQSCTGCGYCIEKSCHIEDDVKNVYNDLLWADAIIVASPVYYRNIPSKLMIIFERAFGYKNDQPLKGKLGAAIAVGSGTCGGQCIVLSIIHNWFLSVGALCVPGELNGLSAVADNPGDILEDQRKLLQANVLGENLLKFSRKIL